MAGWAASRCRFISEEDDGREPDVQHVGRPAAVLCVGESSAAALAAAVAGARSTASSGRGCSIARHLSASTSGTGDGAGDHRARPPLPVPSDPAPCAVEATAAAASGASSVRCADAVAVERLGSMLSMRQKFGYGPAVRPHTIDSFLWPLAAICVLAAVAGTSP